MDIIVIICRRAGGSSHGKPLPSPLDAGETTPVETQKHFQASSPIDSGPALIQRAFSACTSSYCEAVVLGTPADLFGYIDSEALLSHGHFIKEIVNQVKECSLLHQL